MPCGLQLEAASSFLFIKMRLVYNAHVYIIFFKSEHNHLFIGKPFMLQIFLYGGYSKEVSSEKSSEKGIVHADLWSLDPRTWEWNKVCNSRWHHFWSYYTVYMIKLVSPGE